MTTLDSDSTLNRRIELRWSHRTPVGNLHHAPASGGASVTVIVRARNDREVERIGKADDLRLALLYDADSLRRCVAQLDGVESREAVLLVVRNLVDVSRNRENEKRCGSGHCKRGVALRIVPVTLRVERERRVDSDRDDVLVLIARLESR